ncbi:hypothetical protein B4134_0780 [Bacillus safensis]|nr:hypothetical protein B4134_0780 [Bacillus safensis]
MEWNKVMDKNSSHTIYQYIFVFHENNGFHVFFKGFIYFNK